MKPMKKYKKKIDTNMRLTTQTIKYFSLVHTSTPFLLLTKMIKDSRKSVWNASKIPKYRPAPMPL